MSNRPPSGTSILPVFPDRYRGTGILPVFPHGQDGRATFRGLRACLTAMALLFAGCAATPAEPAPAGPPPSPEGERGGPSPPVPTIPPDTIDTLRTATLRIAAEPLGPVPNSGLLLPTVSPDGRWIAALRAAEEAEVYPGDLFTGRRLGPVELVLAPVSDPADQRVILPRGAAWPAWSAHPGAPGRLVAVTYDEHGAPRLAVHDRRTDRTQTLAPGLRRIIAPRFSPDGRSVAFAAHGAEAVGSRIYILDLETRATQPAPAPPAGADLLFPLWIDDQTLIFFLVDGDAPDQGQDATATRGTGILPVIHRGTNTLPMIQHATAAAPVTVQRWRIGEPRAQDLAALRLDPPSADTLFQSLASIADPLSPDGRRLLYYAPGDDRLIALDLTTGEDRPLAAETFAGCWLTPNLAAIATANDLLLAFPTDRSPPRQLTHGRTIPRRADPRRGHILFLTPGDSPWAFQLIRLHFSTTGGM